MRLTRSFTIPLLGVAWPLPAAATTAQNEADVQPATREAAYAMGTTGGTELAEFGPVDPLWQRVPAVADGRHHWAENAVWMLGIAPIGAGLILDDIERPLVEG